MRYVASILVASFLAHGSAYAKDNQVKRGPVPSWVTPSDPLPVPAEAGGLVFIRNSDVLVRLEKDGQLQYIGYRMKILHPNALEAGNIAIAWNPAAGLPVVHSIKVYRNGVVTDVLKKTEFEVLRREDKLEAAMLDGTLTAVARVADLRVGDELEFSFTMPLNDPTLGQDNAGLLSLAPTTAPGRYRLGLSWAEGQKPAIKTTSDLKEIAKQTDQAIEVRFDNPANLKPASDAPPRYYWQRVVEYSDYPVWAAISRRFAPLYSKAATLSVSSPIKNEAARILAAHSAPLDRAAAALQLVQKDVRYIYVGLEGGNLTPATAEQTWERRYGDCKGKTALLLSLLAEMGIEAEAVLANNAENDDGLDERLPNPQMFDHVLVRARINGAAYYLDGTLPLVAQPSITPIVPYRWILPLTAQGSEIERLAWSPPKLPDDITLFEIDARAGFDKPAKISSTTIVRGLDGLRQQSQFSAVTSAELLSGIRQQAIGDTWQTIEEAKWHYDLKAQASVLTIIGTGKIDWDDYGDGAKALALPGGGFNPPSKRIRAADQNQDIPYVNKPEYSCHVTTVRVPSTTDVDQWSSKSGFSTRIFGRNYYRAFDFRGDAVRMVRGSRVELQEIDAATARADNERIAKFDNSKGYIFYEPSSKNYGVSSAVKIPTTSEIDWTSDNVPCLADLATEKAN